MRLHYSQIPSIVSELVESLVKAELIEPAEGGLAEVELDVEAVLKEYLRADRAMTEEAKDLAESKGLDHKSYHKIRQKLAEQHKFGIHDEAIGYLANQLIETFLHTGNVEEVFGADHELRAIVAPILRRHMADDHSLDEEVRKRIKNLQEGTQEWDIQYQQTLGRLRRLRGE